MIGRLLTLLSLATRCLAVYRFSDSAVYHHTWSVRLHPAADPLVVARELNMVYLGPIGRLHHHHLFKHPDYPRYSLHHGSDVTSRLLSHRHVLDSDQQTLLSRRKRSALSDQRVFKFSDPYFSKQWYLKEDYNNVTGAWLQNATGAGIIVTILDDGLEHTHPDLLKNYEPRASADLNSDDRNDDDPKPRYDPSNENKHGTRCAGEVASVADNEYCGVGAAFDSKIGGIRMLDGDVTDAVEARALGFVPKDKSVHIDIYSASWGPDDDGKTVDGPGTLTLDALKSGILEGRNGSGSIFVWASGNGGVSGDSCNCDGYTNSIWTLSIGSVSEAGKKPWYAEECSSTLAVTYSSGSSNERQIITTDLHSKCTDRHTGTSASAPLAAGIFALVLQAYPLLSWRDLQHLVVRTSKRRNLDNNGWTKNGAGFDVSLKFGFGVIDAGGMVELARRWNNVPEQIICKGDLQTPTRTISPGQTMTFSVENIKCQGKISYLEHVQCEVSTGQGPASRGDISLKLTSPSGTQSTLLAPRKHDASTAGFSSWPFMTVHNWGENPHGVWKLTVTNNGEKDLRFMYWRLILYGVEYMPELRNSSRDVVASQDIVANSFFRGSRNLATRSGPVQVVLSLYPIVVVLFSRIV